MHILCTRIKLHMHTCIKLMYILLSIKQTIIFGLLSTRHLRNFLTDVEQSKVYNLALSVFLCAMIFFIIVNNVYRVHQGTLTLCETSRTGTPSCCGVIDNAFYFTLRCRVDNLVSVTAEKKFSYKKQTHSSVPFQAIDSIPSLSCHKPKMLTSQLNYISIHYLRFKASEMLVDLSIYTT